MTDKPGSSDPKGAKDYSTAILEWKKAANRLVVDEAVNDDNSVIAMHPDTMKKLELFRGDTVLIKELNGRSLTVNIAAARGSRPERQPREFQSSLRVYVGNLLWDVDDASLQQLFSEHGKEIALMHGKGWLLTCCSPGQISGQAPNQAGNQLTGLPQQNGLDQGFCSQNE